VPEERASRCLPSPSSCSSIAHKVQDEGTTLREAALVSGVSAEQFDRVVVPEDMVGDAEKDFAAK
jgi:fumarate hydratase, class II